MAKPGNFRDQKLEELKQYTAQAEKMEYHDMVSSDSFHDVFINAITDDNVKTIAIEYSTDISQLNLQIIKDHMRVVNYKIYRYTMAQEDYNDFCKNMLHIDLNAKFNDSSNVIIKGRTARVFAIMPPYKTAPLIVISTVKNPPTKIETLNDREEKMLAEIINEGNVLIAGKSGSGKTYLLNYLLNKYMNNEKRIGIIQEFDEIVSPNAFTDKMTTPPRKPGQSYCDLEFLTEQSNLMRYDLVIVGEIKGAEAWPFITNCSSGTKGIATMHGIDADGTLRRLKTLCLLSKTNLNDEVVSDFIAKAIRWVVLVEDAQVTGIYEVRQATQRGTFSLETKYSR